MRVDNIAVPDGWSQSTIGEACEIHNHLREPISETERKQMQGDYPYYGPTGVVDYLDHYRVEGQYTLIGEDGDHFLKFNDRSMTLFVDGKFNVNNHAHLVQGVDICATEWVYYFYQHADITPFITRQGAGRFKLNKSALLTLPLLLPPLPEQRKIAEILSTWDEAIALTEALIAALQQRKQALMQLLLTGQVRFPGFVNSEDYQESVFGYIPVDWHMKRFGDIFNMSSGSTPSRTRPDYFEGNILWVTSGELNYGLITDTVEKISEEAARDTNLKIYPAGTFLLAITGLEADGTRGRCGILGKPATVNQSCMAFEDSSQIDTLYLFYFYLLFGETIAFNFAQGTKQQSLPRKILSFDLTPVWRTPEKSVRLSVRRDRWDTRSTATNSNGMCWRWWRKAAAAWRSWSVIWISRLG